MTTDPYILKQQTVALFGDDAGLELIAAAERIAAQTRYTFRQVLDMLWHAMHMDTTGDTRHVINDITRTLTTGDPQ